MAAASGLLSTHTPMNQHSQVSPKNGGQLPIPMARFRSFRADSMMSTVKTPTGSPETLLHPDNLAFTMVGADGIRAADDNGKSDPFVVIDVLDAASETRSVVKEVADAWASEQDRDRKNMWKPPKKHQYRTKTIQATLSPRWNENFDLPLRYMIKPFRPIKLRFTAFDEDVVGNNDFLGFAELAINSIEDCLKYTMGDYETSLPFGPRPNNQKDELEYYKAKKDFGTMHLRVRMEGCENFHAAVTRSMGMSMHVNKLVVCVVAASRLKTKDTKTRPVVEFDASGNVEKSAHPKGTAHVTQQALRSSKSTDPTWQPNERFSLFLKAKKKGPTTVKMTVRSGPGGKFLGYYELVLDEKMLATMVGQRRLAKLNLRTRGEDHPDHHEDMVLLLDPKNKKDLGDLRVSIRASAVEVEPPAEKPPPASPQVEVATPRDQPCSDAASERSPTYSKKDIPIRAQSIPVVEVTQSAVPAPASAEHDAERLYKAMKGWGTDEDSIWAALEGMGGQGQWDGVRESFSKRYPTFHDGDVVAALRDELTAEEMQRAEGILSKNQIDLTGKYAFGTPKMEPEATPGIEINDEFKGFEEPRQEVSVENVSAKPSMAKSPSLPAADAPGAAIAQYDSLARNVEKLVSVVQHQQEALQTQQSRHDALLAEQRAQHEAFAEKQLQRQQELLAEQQAALQKQFADQLAEQQAALVRQLDQSQRTFFEQQEQLLSPLRERVATPPPRGVEGFESAPGLRLSESRLDRHRPKELEPIKVVSQVTSRGTGSPAAAETAEAQGAGPVQAASLIRPAAPPPAEANRLTGTHGSYAPSDAFSPMPSMASGPAGVESPSALAKPADGGTAAAAEKLRRQERKQKRREQREMLDREIRHEVDGLARALHTQQETQQLLMMYMGGSPPRGIEGPRQALELQPPPGSSPEPATQSSTKSGRPPPPPAVSSAHITPMRPVGSAAPLERYAHLL
eukprot:TRINITY_DN3214_c0_g1_i2.p1 TRINITY_DN3214_c0_g1~~TRINITY_DN3214_c0_g1_i2.p1  ORF type:complete len:964 (+),score=345.76 TRINITY_DN3214_c0_g1_i2:29-2920(+)